MGDLRALLLPSPEAGNGVRAGPVGRFALAWLRLPDSPAYRTGLIIVGLARCIAMVLIWNDLSCGDREAAAVLVAINSVFQIMAFAALGYFYLKLLPGWLGLQSQSLGVSLWDIACSVLVFLGLPLAAGYLTRRLGEASRGRVWYEQRLLPRLGPVGLYGLLFTVVVLFALQGATITNRPGDVARIALPLLVYFGLMFGGPFLLGVRLHLGYPKTATLAFTAAGNNFELAIAVAIGVFGATSGQPLAGVVGPLIEVPVLVALVYLALWAPALTVSALVEVVVTVGTWSHHGGLRRQVEHVPQRPAVAAGGVCAGCRCADLNRWDGDGDEAGEMARHAGRTAQQRCPSAAGAVTLATRERRSLAQSVAGPLEGIAHRGEVFVRHVQVRAHP